MVDDITLYWLTNSATSSGQTLPGEQQQQLQRRRADDGRDRAPRRGDGLSREIYRAPRSWTERSYRNLIYFNEVDRGGQRFALTRSV